MVIQKNSKHGFTLIETLLVIFFISLFTTFCIPTFEYWYQEKYSKCLAQELRTRLNFVRSEAIKHKTPRFLCQKQPASFQDGWEKQVIRNKDFVVLYSLPILSKGKCLSWRGSLNENTCIKFDNFGFLMGQRGSFYCSEHNKSIKILTIQECGRVRLFD